jgi:hypothetical protein
MRVSGIERSSALGGINLELKATICFESALCSKRNLASVVPTLGHPNPSGGPFFTRTPETAFVAYPTLFDKARTQYERRVIF